MALSFFQTILVGLAGALGAGTRYLLGCLIKSPFPLGTLLINVTGAFAIGLLFSLSSQRLLSPTSQTILATGFLGGYTTFSTMCWEGVQLAGKRNVVPSFCYFASTFILGLLAALLGILLGSFVL